ncbi:ABC transporter permease [Cutibacterium sp. WCA-380-WT-3A]|uniref:ABC transporter permease n=1 Tax=Cutibacterium porci TaxID=2605781 RepID=A0A7K0J9M5_9ACTN|nr:FtsX-like permease family protein [Cutibacterium porci]MSS46684.1 ABC transporter permease [Cutibacterium porci]
MVVGVALATLGLAVGIALPRVAAQQQEVRDARTPILAPDEPTSRHTGFKVQDLQVDGTPWTSFIVSHPDDRLPPGLKHWPQPGHTIVSPRLKSLMDAGIVKISSLGTVDPVVMDRATLASPDELFSITTTADQAGCRELKGFGLTRVGDSGASSRTVWIEVAGLVGLPAAVLLWTSLSLSAASRRDRFKTLVRMGCDPNWCGHVFAAEVSGTAGLGALLGLALSLPVRNALGSSGVLGLTWWPWQARLRWLTWLLVVIMVIVSGQLARRILRRLLASTHPPRHRAHRGGHLLGAVGLLLVVAAIGLEGWMCLTMALAHNGQGDQGVGYIMGGAILGTLGAVMSAHVIVVWCAGREQVRLPTRLGLVLARAHYPDSVVMVVALTIMVGLAGFGSGFVISGTRSTAGDPHRVLVQVPFTDRTASEQQALRRITRPRRMMYLTTDGRTLVAASCADLAAFDPDPQPCPKMPATTRDAPSTWTFDYGKHATIRIIKPVSYLPVTYGNDALLDRNDPRLAGLPPDILEFTADSTTGDLDRLVDQLHDAAPSYSVYAGVENLDTLQVFIQQQGIMRSGMAAGFLLILTACSAAFVELRWGMRRTIAVQQAVGTPARVLRRSFVVQMIVTILPAQSMSLVIGVLAGWAINAAIGSTDASQSFDPTIAALPATMWAVSVIAIIVTAHATAAPRFRLSTVRDTT